MMYYIFQFANILLQHETGCSVYPLNGPHSEKGIHGVKNFNEVAHLFETKPIPEDLTPIVKTLRKVAMDLKRAGEGPISLHLISDGINNENGTDDLKAMDACMKELMESHKNLFLTISVCADDEKLLWEMDKYGAMYQRVGVVDQFRTEQYEQNEKHTTPGFSFTVGDFITKLALVAWDPTVKSLFADAPPSSNPSACD